MRALRGTRILVACTLSIPVLLSLTGCVSFHPRDIRVLPASQCPPSLEYEGLRIAAVPFLEGDRAKVIMVQSIDSGITEQHLDAVVIPKVVSSDFKIQGYAFGGSRPVLRVKYIKNPKTRLCHPRRCPSYDTHCDHSAEDPEQQVLIGDSPAARK